ncbi:MAG TPA: hypothetical protein PLK31_11545 [Chloroflexota bacterium]|nr:hypothetical protein [Chloroflexota bacterium]
MSPQIPLLLTQSQLEQDDDCACPDKAFVLAFDYAAAEVDTDCACPDKGWGLTAVSPHTAVPPLFTTASHTHSQDLTPEHTLVYSPHAPGGPSALNQAALAGVSPATAVAARDRLSTGGAGVAATGKRRFPSAVSDAGNADRLVAHHQCLQSRLPLLLRSQIVGAHGRSHWAEGAGAHF